MLDHRLSYLFAYFQGKLSLNGSFWGELKWGKTKNQGWNFCIFQDPGSEPKKNKEPKITISRTRGKRRRRKRVGEKEKRG